MGLGLLGTVAGLACAGLGFGLWVRSPAGSDWTQRRLEAAISATLHEGDVRLEGVLIDPFGGLVIRGLSLRDRDGLEVLSLDQLVAEFDPAALIQRRVVVPALRADGLRVVLAAGDDGVYSLVRMVSGDAPPSDTPWSGLPLAIDLKQVTVHAGELQVRTPDGTSPWFTGVTLSGGVSGAGTRVALSDLAVSGLVAAPGPLPLTIAGSAVYTPEAVAIHELIARAPDSEVVVSGTLGAEIDLEVRVEQVNLKHLDAFAGSVGLHGTLDGAARVTGRLDDLSAVVTVDGTGASEGGVRLRLDGDVASDRWTWRVGGELHDLHLNHFAPLNDDLILDGALDVGGSGVGWPNDLSMTGRFTGGPQRVAGQDLRSVDLGFAVRDGVVHIDDLSSIDGIVGTLEPSGSVDLVAGTLAVRAIGELSAADLERLGAPGVPPGGRFTATITGVTTGAAPYQVDAEVVYAPLRLDAMTAGRLSVGFTGSVNGTDVSGALRVDARDVTAGGAQLASLTADRLALSVIDGQTSVTGGFSTGPVDAAGLLTADPGAGTLEVSSRAAGLWTRVEHRLGAYALLEQPGTGGSLIVERLGDTTRVEARLDDGGREELRVHATLEAGASAVALEQLRWAPTYRVDYALAAPTRLHLTDSGVHTDGLTVTGALGAATWAGTLGSSGTVAGTLALTDVQLDAVSELYPDRASGLSGLAQLSASLSGTVERPEVQASLRVDDIYIDDTVRYVDVAGDLRWSQGVLEPDLNLNIADSPFAVVRGAVPMGGSLFTPVVDTEAPVAVDIALRPGDFLRFVHMSPLVPPEVPDGRVSAKLDLDGTLREPRVHLAGVAELDVGGWEDPGRVEFDLVREGTNLSFWADLREGFTQRANLGGGGATRFGDVWTAAIDGTGEGPDTADPATWLDEMFVSAVLLGVPTQSLAAGAGLDLDVGGDLVGGLSVSGNPNTPTLEGGVHWLEPTLRDTTLDGAYASLVPDADHRYLLDLNLDFAGDGGLTLQGPAPIAIDGRTSWDAWSVGDLALALRGTEVPLSLIELADPGFTKTSGSASIDGAIRGRLGAPQLLASILVADGETQYLPLDLLLDDIRLNVAVADDAIRLTSLTVRSTPRRKATQLPEVGLEPRISASGTLGFSNGSLGAVDGVVRLRDGAWLSALDDQALRADGNLKVAGLWPAWDVRGALSLVYGKVVLDAAAFIDSAPLKLDPRLRVQRAATPAPSVPEPEAPPLYADFTVDVDVDLQRNLEVDVAMPFIDDLGALGAAVTRADVSSRLGGGIAATLQRGALNLVGEVEVLEGKVRVLRSSFDLDEGTVTFTGADPYNPQLDLNAVMNVTDAQIDMSISGTPEEPAIAFSSEEYPDPTQIMTILLTGRAPDDLDSTQGQGTAQALAQLLLNSMFAGQSLGSFSIEPDGSVRLGVPLSQALYANSTLAATQNPTENRLSVGLEWSVLPKVVASGSLGDRRSSADVYWEIRF